MGNIVLVIMRIIGYVIATIVISAIYVVYLIVTGIEWIVNKLYGLYDQNKQKNQKA